MRIAYVCYWNTRRRDGVSEKIESQLALWRASGHEAELFLLSRVPADGSSLGAFGRAFVFDGMIERPRATRSLYAAVRTYAPDLVYLRYDLFFPPPLGPIRLFPTVVEINSDAQAEAQACSPAAAFYERVQQHLVLLGAVGAICVTHELAEALRRRAQRGLAIEVISNGIALDDISPLPAPAGSGTRLAYLGDSSSWQGIDKLLSLADASPDWHFDLVGSIDPRDAHDNVTCHGFLGPEEHKSVLAQADVAVGTLALHRKRMNEACALKVRRYLAYGMPVILGHEDTDFLGLDPWFLLRLPNTETNVHEHLDQIRTFVAGVKGRRVARDEINGRLSAAAKEKERLAFFARLAQSG